MPPVPAPVTQANVPQPTRYAIQKARGKGWKTLEVGEELAATEARFKAMVKVNPRSYFRLIQLEHLAESSFDGMEFNWKLIQLHDPNQPGAGGSEQPAPPKPRPRRVHHRPRPARAKEKVPLPVRFYAAVLAIGLLVGAFVYLRYGR